MILADTSIWVDYFRGERRDVDRLLARDLVLMHPLVLGELAMGSLPNRHETLTFLRDLDAVDHATNDEVHVLVEGHELYGRGIGFVDAHLLAAVLLSDPTVLWTKDRRLREAARPLGVSFDPSLLD